MTYILGVKLNDLTLNQLIQKIDDIVVSTYTKSYVLVTTNPEFILDAQKDITFKELLNNSWLSVPDGVGTVYAQKYVEYLNAYTGKTPHLLYSSLFLCKLLLSSLRGFRASDYVITGSDLLPKLAEVYSKNSASFYFVGTRYKNGASSSEEVSKALVARFPELRVVGSVDARVEVGTSQFVDLDFNSVVEKIHSDMKLANTTSVDFLFVALGHPRQEKLISLIAEQIPAKISVGVGGAFDFISGRKKRANRVIRQFGMEWFYRLWTDLSLMRLKRVFKATVVFPILLFMKSQDKNSRNP